MRRIDLGPCSAELYEGDPERYVVLLPGAHYTISMPLFWFSRDAAKQRGWSVLAVSDELGEDDERLTWVRNRAERALDAAAAKETLVIGKSLTSIAAGLAAERELPAIWLTPLLGYSAVIEGLSSAVRPTLLVGSPGDPSWNSAAIPANPMLRVLELEGLNHSLEIPGDPLASLDALRAVVAAIGKFLDDLGS